MHLQVFRQCGRNLGAPSRQSALASPSRHPVGLRTSAAGLMLGFHSQKELPKVPESELPCSKPTETSNDSDRAWSKKYTLLFQKIFQAGNAKCFFTWTLKTCFP